MLRAVAAVLLALNCGTLSAQVTKSPSVEPAPVKADAPEHIKEYFRRADKNRADRTKALPKQIVEARKELVQVSRSGNRTVVASARDRINNLEFQLKSLPKAYEWTTPIGAGLRVGSVGSLESAKVRQVIDAGSALVDVVTVTHEYNEQESRVFEIGSAENLVLIKRPTAGWVDDQVVALPGVFWVSGTKQYATAIGGSNTVFVLEPVDLAAYLSE